MKQRARAVLEDWGACLDCRLYEEALVHFCGGEAGCLRRVAISRAGVELGTHLVQCHGDDVFFLVTAFSGEFSAHHSHIERLLMLTSLRGVQWINLNHLTAQFITIERQD